MASSSLIRSGALRCSGHALTAPCVLGVCLISNKYCHGRISIVSALLTPTTVYLGLLAADTWEGHPHLLGT